MKKHYLKSHILSSAYVSAPHVHGTPIRSLTDIDLITSKESSSFLKTQRSNRYHLSSNCFLQADQTRLASINELPVVTAINIPLHYHG